MTKAFSIVIVGAGPVGLVLAHALALACPALKIAVIEPKPLIKPSQSQQPSASASESASVSVSASAFASATASSAMPADFDRRAIALSLSSLRILQALQIGPFDSSVATPILAIHISEQSRFGKITLAAHDYQLMAFASVIPLSVLHANLDHHCRQHPAITFFQPDSLQALVAIEQGWQCQLTTETITTELLIGCDGAQSAVRRLLGIDATTQAHEQVAVLANVSTEKPLQNTAFERFTRTGPVALLPIGEYQATAVVTTDLQHAATLVNDADCFKQELQNRFGFRLGRITTVGQRQQHPLIRQWSKQIIARNALLMGNAAHTLHPVAAQGLNLSLRDVAVFVEQVAAAAQPESIDWSQLLNHYQTLRQPESEWVSDFTERLLNCFAIDLLPIRLLRGLGLQFFSAVPLLKRALVYRGMGMMDSGSQRLIYGRGLHEFA